MEQADAAEAHIVSRRGEREGGANALLDLDLDTLVCILQGARFCTPPANIARYLFGQISSFLERRAEFVHFET